ncbi:cutinase family protein [Corynebacterium kroppenstedtii]|uniref:cutinase family protein n=1 Tax=Corynebacterium sp. PCR 32 TaxID=3351342 RepID=UPI00309E5C28
MAQKGSRSGLRKVLVIFGVVILIGVIAVGVAQWMGSHGRGPGLPSNNGEGAGRQKQPADCAAVEVIAVPGTGESSIHDDPMNPSEFPHALLQGVTGPLKGKFDSSTVKVWTANYPAQLKTLAALNQMNYVDSVNEGVRIVNAELSATHEHCPATKFIIMGFSQGAAVAGDIASDIGNNRGVVPSDTVAGVTALADPRRVSGEGHTVGAQPHGVGSEIALQPFAQLLGHVVPGLTARGPRPGGMGDLNDRVNEICAPGDGICDMPTSMNPAPENVNALLTGNSLHAQYGTNPNVIEGTTAIAWILQWSEQLVKNQI